MARVSLWLQLLLVVLMLRQSAVASDRSNKQKGETDCLEEALKTTRAQNHDCETWAGSGQEHLTHQMRISQNTSRELQKTEAVITDLKKQLEAKEEALKDNSEKQEQLQTAVNRLTKTLESLNQTSQVLREIQKDVCCEPTCSDNSTCPDIGQMTCR